MKMKKATLYYTEEWFDRNTLCDWEKHEVWKSLDNTKENHQKLLDEIDEEYSSSGGLERGRKQYLHIELENKTGEFAQKSHDEQQRAYNENF